MSRFGKGALLMILSALGFSAMQIAIAKTAQGICRSMSRKKWSREFTCSRSRTASSFA